MLSNSINGELWQKKVVKKILGFLNNSPVLCKFVTLTKNGIDGVLITPSGFNNSFFYAWDYETDPKNFVSKIKKDLIDSCYPRIIQTVNKEIELTPLEMAEKIEDGFSLDKIPSKKIETYKVLWRIDKVFLWKDCFILVKESENGQRENIEVQYRYKLNTSSVIFLNKYRNKEFSSDEEAGKFFFENAILINEIKKK